jgi:hypothetical protein
MLDENRLPFGKIHPVVSSENIQHNVKEPD